MIFKKLGKQIKGYMPYNKKEVIGEKDYKTGRNKNITTPYMDIIINRAKETGELVEIAKFRAVQDKDRNYNFKVTNEEFDFKDDLELTKNSLIDSLTFKLDLTEKTKKEKIEIVEKAIKYQQELIKNIKVESEKGEYDNNNKNIHDEEYRLCTLKVLLHTVKFQEGAIFEKTNIEGFRERQYVLTNSLLIPIPYNPSTVSLYPYVAINRKTHREVQDMIDRDYIDENTSKYGNFFKNFLTIATVCLFILNVWWSMEYQSNANELAKMSSESNLAKLVESCGVARNGWAEYLKNQVETNDKLINYATNKLINDSKDNLVNNNEGAISLE